MSKPLVQWSAEEARQLLTDSPWAKPTAIGILPQRSEAQMREGGRMGVGGKQAGFGPLDESLITSTGKRKTLQVRWESAMPVRAAEMKAGEIGAPDWEGDFYAIAVYDVPGIPAGSQKSLTAELKHTTFLRSAGQKDLKPARVEIIVFETKVARIVFLFPRIPELSSLAAPVEFVTQIGRIRLAQSFRTSEMQYQGKVEL